MGATYQTTLGSFLYTEIRSHITLGATYQTRILKARSNQLWVVLINTDGLVEGPEVGRAAYALCTLWEG